MADEKLDLPQGTLDLLILKALSLGPMHGWAISQRIQQVSRDTLQIPQGSLYPALHRLERKKWIEADWAVSENQQRVRVYRLTAAGRKQLAVERSRWEQISQAIAGIMQPPATESES